VFINSNQRDLNPIEKNIDSEKLNCLNTYEKCSLLVVCYCYIYQVFYRALDVSLQLIQEIYFYLYSAFFGDYGTRGYL